jgi:pimeloyl-ACP methyl ester carboxylesterase
MRSLPLGLPFLAVVLVACGGTPVVSSAPSTAASAASSPNGSPSTDLVADVDVGGGTMHLVCVGPTDTGKPTILLEAGGGLGYDSWSEVLTPMQKTHRLCAYDRLGLGASSQPAEPSRTAVDQAADLHKLLEAADVRGPFVLGAHSFGGIIGTLFTQAYPNDVVGLVFVDPQAPRQSAAFLKALPPASADESSAVKEIRDVLEDFETDPSQNPEHVAIRESGAKASAALDAPGPFFGDRPVIVLSAGKLPPDFSQMPPDVSASLTAARAAAQHELADESTAGSFETVPGAGHNIQVENPPAVIDALEKVLAAVKG